MGVYAERVLPRFQDKVMDRKDLREVRARIASGLSGEVLEVGFGTGLNVAHYPPGVTNVAAIEPSRLCKRIAEARIARTSCRVEFAGLSGEALALPSESFDAALSTWTLCTIPDVDAALIEIFRVLKPGGSLHFVEHGLAPDHGVATWQERIEPAWKRVAGGCHLTRQIAELIERASFRVERLDTYYMSGPRMFGYTYEGVAHKQ